MNQPRYAVYSGRLLNLCMERAMLLGQSNANPQKWPTLRELARSTYVRDRLGKGCA